MNPYALSGTAPSRRRVYLFHHLGDPLYITVFEVLCNTRRARRYRRACLLPEALSYCTVVRSVTPCRHSDRRRTETAPA